MPTAVSCGQMVGDRAEDHGRHERQRTDQEHRPQQHAGERQVVGAERAGGLRERAS